MGLPRLDSPWPWIGVAAALALLLLARRGPDTRAWFSGVLELAREVARPPASARAARRRPPAAVVAAAAALVAGGFALAGPHSAADARGRTWTVHVDASPSLYLPWAPPGESPGPDSPTRLARALAAFEAQSAARRGSGDRFRWRRTVDGLAQVFEGPLAPAQWRSAPARPQPPPDWAALDLPGALWVSDDAQGVAPRAARACLSGGSAIPGPVAALGRARLSGTPQALSVDSGPAPAPRLALEGLDEDGALGRLVQSWCAARGVERVVGPAELVLAPAPAGEVQAAPTQAGRDGWTWELAGPRGSPRGSPWLADAHGALVAWSPGRVELAGAGFGEPIGDAAAFAGSWSELLDRACLAPPDVVATAERGAAGEARVTGPGEPPPRAAAADPDAGAALFALLAGLLGGAALALAARAAG